mmetsp:Transcript_31857/g.74469  ORF Transcript_31857/g.74469 Transcript_31857/m.74469 type:complete len:396 (+) Transcript_31857:159-1346(+)
MIRLFRGRARWLLACAVAVTSARFLVFQLTQGQTRPLKSFEEQGWAEDEVPEARCKHDQLENVLRKSLLPHQQDGKANTSILEEYPCLGRRVSLKEVLQIRNRAGEVVSLPHMDEVRFNTCAVVGSGGSLFERGFGHEIDGHDVVIRMNHHVANISTIGDLGCRTTFHTYHLSNGEQTISALEESGDDAPIPLLTERNFFSEAWLECLLANEETCPCMINRTNASRERLKMDLLKTQGQKRSSDPWRHVPECTSLGANRKSASWRWWPMISPELWLSLTKPCRSKLRLAKSPSTGFRIVLLTLRLCQHISVYGMSGGAAHWEVLKAAKSGSVADPAAEATENYEEWITHPDWMRAKRLNRSTSKFVGFKPHHDIPAEHRWYDKLASLGIIRQPDK